MDTFQEAVDGLNTMLEMTDEVFEEERKELLGKK